LHLIRPRTCVQHVWVSQRNYYIAPIHMVRIARSQLMTLEKYLTILENVIFQYVTKNRRAASQRVPTVANVADSLCNNCHRWKFSGPNTMELTTNHLNRNYRNTKQRSNFLLVNSETSSKPWSTTKITEPRVGRPCTVVCDFGLCAKSIVVRFCRVCRVIISFIAVEKCSRSPYLMRTILWSVAK